MLDGKVAEGGGICVMTIQAVDVTKLLASTGRAVSKGHRNTLDDDGDDDADIQHKAVGRNIKLHKNSNALVMKMAISPPGDEVTCRGRDDKCKKWVPPARNNIETSARIYRHKTEKKGRRRPPSEWRVNRSGSERPGR